MVQSTPDSPPPNSTVFAGDLVKALGATGRYLFLSDTSVQCTEANLSCFLSEPGGGPDRILARLQSDLRAAMPDHEFKGLATHGTDRSVTWRFRAQSSQHYVTMSLRVLATE